LHQEKKKEKGPGYFFIFLDGGFQGISKFMTAVDFDRPVRPSRNQQAKEKKKKKIEGDFVDTQFLVPFLVCRFEFQNH
jgi:hypothetical protein